MGLGITAWCCIGRSGRHREGSNRSCNQRSMQLVRVDALMPTVPSSTKCRHLGCKNPRSKLTTSCLDHGGRDQHLTYRSEERDAANAAYHTPKWKRKRTAQLSSQPLCQACLCVGIVTAATEVDHVFPWRQIGASAFHLNLFQSLCKACHTHKTSEERKGRIMHYEHAIPRDYEVRDYGRIMGVDNPVDNPDVAKKRQGAGRN